MLWVHDDARSILIVLLQAIDEDIVLVACKWRRTCNGWAGTGKTTIEQNSEKDGSDEKCASKLEAPKCLSRGELQPSSFAAMPPYPDFA